MSQISRRSWVLLRTYSLATWRKQESSYSSFYFLTLPQRTVFWEAEDCLDFLPLLKHISMAWGEAWPIGVDEEERKSNMFFWFCLFPIFLVNSPSFLTLLCTPASSRVPLLLRLTLIWLVDESSNPLRKLDSDDLLSKVKVLPLVMEFQVVNDR